MRAYKTVLLVDDEPDNRVIFGTILRHVGFRVVEAATGPEGVRLARERRPDLVLLDISLPGMDGWDVMREMRRDGATEAIPVVALTAHRLHAADLEAAGFCGYLQKPLLPRLVAEEVERCLGLRGGERASALGALRPSVAA